MLLDRWEFAQTAWLEEPPFGYTRVPGWLPARVPGYVHLDLVVNGIVRHPHEGMAELGCQWVDECDWSYRCRFDWAGRAPALLRFEGLDTICTIYLNGEEIGRHDNMFLPLEIDVSPRLLPDNELRVDFESAARVGRERRAAYFASHGIPDDVLNFDERAFVRKAQYMFGWDWGPRLVSCGIWKPVELLSGGDIPVSAPPRESRVQLCRETDAFGESFEFIVDGKPLWVRGANWIPLSSFPSEYSTESGQQRLRELLYSAKQMGMNMLRVWGGGFYESEEFYDACDLHEILVWQDFPFACSYSPDDDDFVDKVRQEAIYHVKRLRHHKCLALWCGNNENLTMWEGKWGGADRQPDRFHGERIWNEVLRDVVAEHDPGRPYIATSPVGGPDANSGGYGDQHYWDVWHGRGDWVHYEDSAARFSSEFGFPSACGEEAWKQARCSLPQLPPSVSEEAIDHANPAPGNRGRGLSDPPIRWHDKTGRPLEYWLELLTKHYPEPRDLEEFIYYSQLNQRDAMRCAIEHYRRSEFCKGTLIWQLNDLWPAQSWSLVDSAGQWKAAGYEFQRLYADIVFAWQVNENDATLWCVNDSDASLQTEAYDQISIFDLQTTGSTPVRTLEIPKQTIAPCERRIVGSASIQGLDRTRSILYTNLEGEPWRLLCEPKDLQFREPKIRARVETEGLLEVCPDVPVIDLFLWDPTGRARFHALPHTFPSGNFRTFECSCPWSYGFSGEISRVMGRSLAGVHEIELVEGPIWP